MHVSQHNIHPNRLIDNNYKINQHVAWKLDIQVYKNLNVICYTEWSCTLHTLQYTESVCNVKKEIGWLGTIIDMYNVFSWDIWNVTGLGSFTELYFIYLFIMTHHYTETLPIYIYNMLFRFWTDQNSNSASSIVGFHNWIVIGSLFMLTLLTSMNVNGILFSWLGHSHCISSSELDHNLHNLQSHDKVMWWRWWQWHGFVLVENAFSTRHTCTITLNAITNLKYNTTVAAY